MIIWFYQLRLECKLATVGFLKLTFRPLALRQSHSSWAALFFKQWLFTFFFVQSVYIFSILCSGYFYFPYVVLSQRANNLQFLSRRRPFCTMQKVTLPLLVSRPKSKPYSLCNGLVFFITGKWLGLYPRSELIRLSPLRSGLVSLLAPRELARELARELHWEAVRARLWKRTVEIKN